MTTLPSGLPVVVDRAVAVPLATQIAAQLEAAVAAGALHAGDRLPSSRDLAATLGVSRTVVTSAYARLLTQGWLEGRPGSGTFVANVTPPAARPAAQPASPPPSPGYPERGRVPAGRPVPAAPQQGADLVDLRPGSSWAEGIDPAAWRRAWRQAGAYLPSQEPDPYGLPGLRAEIAAYLRRSRGLAVTPAQVLVTQGVSDGFALLVGALLAPGDAAGTEEPGYPAARAVLHRAGARVVPCRVDAHGIVPGELPGDLALLYTSPAHQYPLGGRLPVSRRQALVAWARSTGALIVEDDYDSEFRYDVGPLPALHSMAPDVIVYLGTASKVLAAGFGAGWLVAAPELVGRLAALRRSTGGRIPEPVQHAVLALLQSGDLERHIRRMRLEYARRRAALVDGLAAPGPFRLLGDTAGMHVVIELPAGASPGLLIEAAARRGVRIYPLDRYYAGPPALNGVIIGYGTATLPQVRRAAAELSRLLRQWPEPSQLDARSHDDRALAGQPEVLGRVGGEAGGGDEQPLAPRAHVG